MIYRDLFLAVDDFVDEFEIRETLIQNGLAL